MLVAWPALGDNGWKVGRVMMLRVSEILRPLRVSVARLAAFGRTGRAGPEHAMTGTGNTHGTRDVVHKTKDACMATVNGGPYAHSAGG